MSFTHLHLHTEYSLLDGAIRLKALPTRLKEMGMSACAITDHGVMYGVVDFYRSLKEAGIKPILGCEVYVAARRLGDKDPRLDKSRYHLVLLAETEEGYHNLMKLVSVSFVEGFYHRPRVDMQLLAKHSKGLIALSACLQGEVPQLILQGQMEVAEQKMLEYRSIFGANNYYLELQNNGFQGQKLVNAKLIELGRKHNIPLVATNDSHYLTQAEAAEHKILLCMRTGTHLESPDAFKFDSQEMFLRSEAEMQALFANVPDALENTEVIAQRCNVELDFKSRYLPQFTPPPNLSVNEYLRELAYIGLHQRLSEQGVEERRLEYEKRLEHELDVIIRMGFADYYLVVWDFIAYARRQGIIVGPGRGSGAGSLVAYCLRIINIDPIQYSLLFERFLNEERVSSPDFDIDFCYERRGEVLDYVTEKYGAKCVSQVLTFGTLAAKAVVRDVARVFGWPQLQIDRLAKMIPSRLNITLEAALLENPELKRFYESNPEIAKVIDIAQKFEGMPRHASTHASGVVVAKCPIAEVAPLALNDNSVVVQLTKDNLEMLGLIKIDFLGLRTLTVLRSAAESIKMRHGVELDFETLPCNEKAVYQMIGEGNTAGVFQLESHGMTEFMKKLKPEVLEDIIAGISLYRPGPMDQIPAYLEGRHRPATIKYDTPLLEDILQATHGCMIYQEQVMQAVQKLAGFSLGQGDIVRRAMAKKKPKDLAKFRELFVHGGADEAGNVVKGAVANGLSEEVANKIYDDIMAFAGYAFNKSHAAGYAVIAYQTAYVKYHYPLDFFASLLNANLGSANNAAKYIPAIKKEQIAILPPDVNASVAQYMATDHGIRAGLVAVKNVSHQVVSSIVAERIKSGPFCSFGDFLRRQNRSIMKLNTLESLIRAGALDGFGLSRGAMRAALEPYWRSIQDLDRSGNHLQTTLFGEVGDSGVIEPDIPAVPDDLPEKMLQDEKEMLGFYLTGHPLDGVLEKMKQRNLVTIAVVKSFAEAEEQGTMTEATPTQFEIGGIITKMRERKTKKGDMMADLVLEDQSDACEVVVFPKIYAKHRAKLKVNALVAIKGHFEARYDSEEQRVLLDDVSLLQQERIVFLWQGELTPERFTPLGQELKQYHGSTEVWLRLANGDEKRLREQYWLDASPAVIARLGQIFGADKIVVERE